jgi:hypothetical protein
MFDHSHTAAVSRPFLDRLHSPEREGSTPARLGVGQPLASESVGLVLEMKAELVVELAIERLTLDERADAVAEITQPFVEHGLFPCRFDNSIGPLLSKRKGNGGRQGVDFSPNVSES